jgi:hypothetical protein
MEMEPNEQRETPAIGVTRPRVIVVGNLTIDDVVLPDGTTRMSSAGGNSLYTALGVRLWQPRVGLVTRRGEDFPGDLSVGPSSTVRRPCHNGGRRVTRSGDRVTTC